MSTRDQRREFRVGIGRLGLAGFILMAMPVHGAIFNWTNTTSGAASWSTSGNWLGGVAPGSGGAADMEIRFFTNSSPALPNSVAIIADNNLGSGSPAEFALNIMTLNGIGPAVGNGTVTLTGASLVLTNNAGTLPVVNLNGTNNTAKLTYQIANNLRLADNTSFQGTGGAAFAFSGVISGGGNLTKTNTSTLTLTGSNTYTGATVIQRIGANNPSVLEANDGVGLPITSSLQFDGGVLQSIGNAQLTFIRNLGTGAGQVQWLSNRDGGFAANGAKLTVNIGGNPTPSTLTWGGANFLAISPSSRVLLFGSATATAETELKNNLDLGGLSASRVVFVIDNPNSGGDFATISGVITNGGLEKQGGGTLKLTAVNKYTGNTTLSGGTLQATDGVGLPTASFLFIGGGGRLESSGTFTRGLAASGAGKVGWGAGSAGGFSAAGGKLTVTFAGVSSPLVWDMTANFITNNSLVLGSVTADSEVEITHNINLNDAQRTISVTDNPLTNTDVATLSGIISSTTPSLGSILKQGAGTLRLTGVNTYAGTNSIQEGVLEAIDGIGLPTNSLLRLNSNAGTGLNGVFQSTGTFTRALGSVGGTVQWAASRNAGFSAAASKLTVNLGGSPTPSPLIWASTVNFVSSGNFLVFGSATSGAEIEFQNPIDFNGAARTIQVDDNPTTSADFASLSGALSGGNNSDFIKTGTGTLVLSATNTFSGVTTVSAGTLLVNGWLSNATYAVTVGNGCTLGGAGVISRPVTVVSNGLIMGGSAGVVGTLTTTNITLAEGAIVACDIAGSTADLIAVNGKLTLPSNATVRLNYTGSLPASMTLFSAASLAGATNSSVLSGWTLVPASTRSFMIQGNSVVLSPRRGSVISLQ